MSKKPHPLSGFVADDDSRGRRATESVNAAEQFAPALEGYRLEWETGVYRSVIDAFELCALNGLRMPPWLLKAVMDDLFYAYQNRPRGDHEMARKGEVEDRESYRHDARYRAMQLLLNEQEADFASGGRPPAERKVNPARRAKPLRMAKPAIVRKPKPISKAEAAQDASELLKGKGEVWADERSMQASYNRVAREGCKKP